MFPPNPATTNIPNKPLTMRDRTYANAKQSGRGLAEAINGMIPDVRGAIQYMADNPSVRIGADRPFKEAQQPVSPLTQGAQQSPIGAALSGPGPGSDASRLTAPTQGIPRGLTGDVPTDMAPGRPSGADFPRYQPIAPGIPGDASATVVSPTRGIAGLSPLGAPPAMATDFNNDPATRDISRRFPTTLPGDLQGPLPRSAYEQGGDPNAANAAYGDMVTLAGALRGQQQYDASDVGRMQSGRIADMTANRNMGQMTGGDYADMDPARAAASSQAMYRAGGLGGASMGAREDALEQAERANPPGSSYEQRFRNTRQELRGIAEALQPGESVSRTSADGTRMLASRGNAQARASDDPIRLAQQDTNRRIRQERNEGLRNAGQMRLARNAAMQEAAANPENSPLFQALAMNDPRGAAAIMQARAAAQAAQGSIQLGQAEIAQRGQAANQADVRAGERNEIAREQVGLGRTELAQNAEAAKQRFDLETQRLAMDGKLSEAQIAERGLLSKKLEAEIKIMADASTPEAQAAALRTQQQNIALETGQAPATAVSNLFKPANQQGTSQPQNVQDALESRGETAPQVEAVLGQGASGKSSESVLGSIYERLEKNRPLSDSDLQTIQQDFQARLVSDPDFGQPESMIRSAFGRATASGSIAQKFNQMMSERLRSPVPITAAEVQKMREEAKKEKPVAIPFGPSRILKHF